MAQTGTTPPKTSAAPDSRSGIQVIERMMQLLDALSRYQEPVGLKQLALETGLHPSTAHRILAAMCTNRFAERSEPGCYRLGIRLLELGNAVRSRIDIRDSAMPIMQKLHQQLGESVNLGVRRGDEIMYLEHTASGRSSVCVVHGIGARAPLHVTSVGKLYLAAASAAEVRDYATRTQLQRFTHNSITTLVNLLQEIDNVKRSGVSYDQEEVELGLCCLAAPVYDEKGELIAGLSISAPTERFRGDWAPLLKQSAAQISAAIGYRKPTITTKPARVR